MKTRIFGTTLLLVLLVLAVAGCGAKAAATTPVARQQVTRPL